jgi:hypothetical protein
MPVLVLEIRVSEFHIKKDSASKYYNLSSTEFSNFALPSFITILFSLGTYCFQPLNTGIVALNPTEGDLGFRAFVLSST